MALPQSWVSAGMPRVADWLPSEHIGWVSSKLWSELKPEEDQESVLLYALLFAQVYYYGPTAKMVAADQHELSFTIQANDQEKEHAKSSNTAMFQTWR